MNVEEAKVPDVEGNWQYIEIFLFSNGQQNSPPRKHHIRADELYFWEDTLNLLAKSHYGLQSPPVNLYTTDGQLVEGPLELKDGLAYVAVTPPETFIDAGYQKYLIRASRSWEKRQARMKIPECVLEEICCLCPEKEWCCDLKTCCLCPEKEDEDSQKSFICATGHPGVRSAGGHFMSSAPSKPAVADDYRPKSGKIASTAENAVRSDGPSHVEFGYSPVEYLTKPDEYGATLVEYEANPSKHALRLSENESRLGESRTRPDEYGTKLNENAMRPGEYEAYPGEHAARLSKNGTTPGELRPRPNDNVSIASKNGVRPVEYGARLNEYGARQGEYVTSLNENGPRLSKDGARLTEYATRPGENGAIPSEYETRPSINGAKASVNVARPGEYEVYPEEHAARLSKNGSSPNEFRSRPDDNVSIASKNGVRPVEYGVRLNEHVARQGEYVTSLSENGPRLSKDGARLTEYATRPGENGAIPGEYETRPSINGAKTSVNVARPGEYETRPSEQGPRPGEYKIRRNTNGDKSSEYEVRPGEYDTRPHVNGVKLSEYKARPVENETRSSIGVKRNEYGAKPAEHETKPGVNGIKPSEYETRPGEYETRPTVNGAEPTEYKARPGENGAQLARPVENETRSSIQEVKPNEYDAKPAEHETNPGFNGAKPSEYETRPGEYETRPTVNGAEPSEYKARPVVNESRSSIIEVKPGVYETRPSVNRAKPSEYETRSTVNGAEPSDYKATTGKNGAHPSEFIARSIEKETRSSIKGVKPNEYGAKPAEYETKPGVDGAKPSEYEARPSEYKARTGEYESRPIVNGAMLGEDRARPGKNDTRRSVNGAKESEYGARTGEYESRLKENGAKPGVYETRPSINGAKPGEYRNRSGEFSDRSVEQRTRPDEYRPRPANATGAWSDEDGVRLTVHEARPGNEGPWSNEIESKKKAYVIALRDNEKSLDDNVDRPDKDIVDGDSDEECKFLKQSSTLSPIDESELEKQAEYGVTDGDQRDKQIDEKSRASGNGGRGGERRGNGGGQSGRENDTLNGMSEPRTIKKESARRPSELRPSGIENKRRPSQQRGEIEQTRRLSGQAGADKQGGRTGELIREYEHGGRVSEQKGKETYPVGRAGVNTARLSEQRNKQSDHLARLDGRESIARADHEVRAGDQGLRSSDHDTELVNPGSRVADPGARAAVSRASPRDRMSSITRTSNLGQSKLGTPGTRVDETAAKLDESEIKNRVGYPGARQSSVGGTGAAGASQISEAQQHARRSSLSTGTALTGKKRLSIGQNSSLLRKPTSISSVLRKSEDKQPIKTNKEILPKRMTDRASAIPVPASNDARQSKTLHKDLYQNITPPTLQPQTISITNLGNLAMNKAPLENFIDEKDIIVVSTHSLRDPESEIRSMRIDSVKKIVDVFKRSSKETQTELIYVEKSKASITVNEGVQTNTEAGEQHRQEVSASNLTKVNSYACTCALCRKRDHKLVDPDENIISIQNKGDVINLKLNIEIRNIVRSVYSCQKNGLRSRSLTNITSSQKESRISIDDGMFVRPKRSLQSIINHQYFRGNAFESSPKLMVVQCAGCGKLNYPPRCDLPPCCDNNKKYFVLLANSLNEDMDKDMDNCCNFNPPCRPCGLRQSQLKRSSSDVPLKRILSEMTLDTITNVTLSGVPLQSREMGKKKDTTCQTKEPQGECMMNKRKVNISEYSGMKCDNQKESSSTISVTTQADNLKTKHSCRKLCPQKCDHEDSQVFSEFYPPVTSCPKVQSACSHVRSHTSPQGCMPVSPTTSTCCPKPLPSIQVQTQVWLQAPQVSDAQTQTQWNSIVLQARLHPDGRYSFHLPPLNQLKTYPF